MKTRPGLGGQLPLDILPWARPRGTTAPGYFIPPSPLLSYIILLYPNDEDPTTVHSNDTLVDTSFQLISDFFHLRLGASVGGD